MPEDQESDSEGSSVENLGDVTQFGLTGALAQMANLTFMAGAPGKEICFIEAILSFLQKQASDSMFSRIRVGKNVTK